MSPVVDRQKFLEGACYLSLFAGMILLLLGLNVLLAQTLGQNQVSRLAGGAMNELAGGLISEKTSGALGFASLCFSVGAALLLPLPILQRNAMLIVLQVFLTISAVMFFVDLQLVFKIPVRLGLSLTVIAFLKYELKMLPGFRWKYLLWPPYYWKVMRGQFGPAYCGVMGIDFLGVGYAFDATVFLTIGAMFLFRYAQLSNREVKAEIGCDVPILKVWMFINGTYSVYGILLIAISIKRMIVA